MNKSSRFKAAAMQEFGENREPVFMTEEYDFITPQAPVAANARR